MPLRAPLNSATRYRLLARFQREEDGTISVFVLILFTLMIMMGGLAVDIMRYEQVRTSLQQTLDRCTLAGAALSQDLDPEAVCRDYVAKAGLTEYLTSVEVTEGLNYRQVQAEAMAVKKTFFAQMVGIDELSIPGDSMAEQRITDIEIFLVLDVSGSMSGTKIANLKVAAKDFVQTVMEDNAENRVSIGIVPYNAQVNIPEFLRNLYTTEGTVTTANANCFQFPTTAFTTPAISRTVAIPLAIFADVSSSTSRPNSSSYVAFNSTHSSNGATNAWQFCNPRNGGASGPLTQNLIMMPTSNQAALNARIDALFADGNTSITLGMKWAVSLLDPASRPIYATLASQGHMQSIFSNRPYEYNQEDTMKVIVLMTDGEHVQHTIIAPAYRGDTPNSPIWRAPDGNYSIQFTSPPSWANGNQFWVPHLGTWRSTAWTNNSTPATRLSWVQVWQNQRVSWVAWQLYGRALGTDNTTRRSVYDTWMNNFTDPYHSVSSMNTTLQQSCTQARNNNVIVFGIAFEAPTNGQTQIRNCSTSMSHYYEASGLDIQTAFNAIAAQISQLRLTQ